MSAREASRGRSTLKSGPSARPRGLLRRQAALGLALSASLALGMRPIAATVRQELAPARQQLAPARQQLAPARQQLAAELEGADAAFLELVAPSATAFAGEKLELRIVLGFEKRFLAERMIQPFRQALDVPAQVLAPWLDRGERSAAEEGASLAVNDGVSRVQRLEDRERAGATFAVFELRHRLVPREIGELRLEPPELRFAYATRFRDDLLQGRVAEDRRDAVVRGEPLVMRIVALPSDGRPEGFSGAVGRFTVEASAEPRELAVGESIKVTLRVHGEGDLTALEPPDLAHVEGFHFLGRVERPDDGGRTFVYDLAAERADVRGVPPIALVFFEPGEEAGYRTAWTEEIPITVRAPAGGRPDGPAHNGSTDAGEPSSGFNIGWVESILIGLVAVLLALPLLRRRAARASAP